MVQKFMEKIRSVERYWSKFYCSGYYVTVTKYSVKCGTSLRFWENKGWINEIDPMVGFSGISDTG